MRVFPAEFDSASTNQQHHQQQCSITIPLPSVVQCEQQQHNNKAQEDKMYQLYSEGICPGAVSHRAYVIVERAAACGVQQQYESASAFNAFAAFISPFTPHTRARTHT